MGALSFNYSIFSNPNDFMGCFEYKRSIPLIEYRLKYKRYAALSDASIFDSPVAVTKVATGGRLYDLFVKIDEERDSTYFQELKSNSILPARNAQYINGNEHIRKIGDVNIDDAEFFHRILRQSLLDVETINKYYPGNTVYISDNFRINRDIIINHLTNDIDFVYFGKDLYDDKGYFIPIPSWTKDVVKYTETIVHSRKPIEMLPRETLRLPRLSMKIPYHKFIEMHKTTDPVPVNIYMNYIAKRNRLGWSIYPDINADRVKDDHLVILKDNTLAWSYDYRKVNYTYFFIGHRDLWKMKIYKSNIFGRRPVYRGPYPFIDMAYKNDYIMNIASLILQGEPEDKKLLPRFSFVGAKALRNVLNIINNGLVGKVENKFNVITPLLNAARAKEIGYIFKNCTVSRRHEFYNTSIFERIYGGNKGLNIVFDSYDCLAISEGKILSYFQNYTPSGVKPGKGLICNNIVSSYASTIMTKYSNNIQAKKDFKQGSVPYYEDAIASLMEKDVFQHQGYSLKACQEMVCELSLADFTIKKAKYAITLNSLSSNLVSKDLDSSRGIWARKCGKDIRRLIFKEDAFTKKPLDISTSFMSWVKRSKKDFSMHESSFLLKLSSKPFNYLPPLVTTKKEKSNIDTYVNVLTRDKKLNLHSPDKRIIKVSLNKKDFTIYNHIIPIHKDKINMIIWPKHDFIYKIGRKITLYDNDEFIHKISKDFDIIASMWFAYKESYNMRITDPGTYIHKMNKDIFLEDNFNDIVRNIYTVAVSHYIKSPNWEMYGGFIVPISRVRYQVVINRINVFVKKRYRDIMVTEGDFGSVLSRPAMLDFNIGIDKMPKDVFLNYVNEMLIKTNFKAFIEEGTYGFKVPYSICYQHDMPWGYLNPKHVQTEKGVFGNKKNIDTFLYADELLDKKYKPTMIDQNKSIFIEKQSYVGLFDDEWLDKLPYMCYYSYDIWGKTGESKVFESSQVFGTKVYREARTDENVMGKTQERHTMLEFGSFASKNIQNGWYEEGVFSERLIKSSVAFKQLDWISKSARKCDIAPNDFGNWAWVYESPDPFQYDIYGIDELLLPEKDTRYEDFEDLIFDREHMRPRNPLKELSDTQWIAKLPIRHPVKKYKDVGRIYDDSAIKLDNYFGIPSSVIRDMSLRYYRIWEKNMFKFSTMTMQQAANLMLEYIWSWIPDYYPLNQLEQAYRAFQLIRWYTECAVINNSQYIISYEYANLAWPDAEHKGICHIPSDLQEYDPTNVLNNSNDTMYSDIAPGHLCLRNNPIYTGSNNVWVTFKIKNKRNTSISINLYNESGAVRIYLNDRLIDIIYARGLQKLVYNIKYTGDVNEFKIEKKAADNLDDNFIIGHISIANQAFKDLTIDFDPVHRAGNQPLNEVAQKLVQFAALHDRKDIAYHEMLTKNLGVSEVYKMLEKYWRLHHEAKLKGKRLTIKQI